MNKTCAHCGTRLGAAYLTVHDATGGPAGSFCSGNGQRCYLDALKRHEEAEPADIRRLLGDLEALESRQSREISSVVSGKAIGAATGGPDQIVNGRAFQAPLARGRP